MLTLIHKRIKEKITQVIQKTFDVSLDSLVLNTPPEINLGDVSTPVCFELAKMLRRPPRKIAEEIAKNVLPVEGVAEIRIAGAGYLNIYLDRSHVAAGSFGCRDLPITSSDKVNARGKAIVEHTSINPNKAAHIGHLRNALLGDSLVRLLRHIGRNVEVQNYIDDTGVQVADVVVGFVHLEKRSPEEVSQMVNDDDVPFDYFCWDLYARVSKFYEEDESRLILRSETLEAVEGGSGDLALMARLISDGILKKHIKTMQRLDIQYDLLAQESEILRLEFWKKSFELLKNSGALKFEDSGKNKGCWVMALSAGQGTPSSRERENGSSRVDDEVKIVVRSNGTVTYVGKDIAYHLWKFGLLECDFTYERAHRYKSGHEVWKTSPSISKGAPSFGTAEEVYTVIDRRQSYLQGIVASGMDAIGFSNQSKNLHHIAYEIVGLSHRCTKEMGIILDQDQKRRSYVEVSGRKGLGVKADDLIDRIIAEALREVKARNKEIPASKQVEIATDVGIGALRYFLLKYTRNSLIVFDFHDALSFEGETGPYLQYTVVRARNIFRKYGDLNPQFHLEDLEKLATKDLFAQFLDGPSGDSFWEVLSLSLQVDLVAEHAVNSLDPSNFAKFAFRLAQAFNNFYHRCHVLAEKDKDRQLFLLSVVYITSTNLARVLDLLGIRVPEKM